MLVKDYILKEQSKELIEINKTQQKEIDDLDFIVEDIVNQCFIDTATWGLDYWEEFLNIPIEKNKSLGFRRSTIKAKIRGQGTVTVDLIKNVSESFSNGKVEVIENVAPYTFEIKFVETRGASPNLEDLEKVIDDIKPAHLAVRYKLIVLTQSNLYMGATSFSGETITVYPWSPKEINSKGTVKVALGSNIGVENITIYPKKEV